MIASPEVPAPSVTTAPPVDPAVAGDAEVLVEDVSIDGMCGVY